MFRGTLPGMDYIFHTDPPAGSIITLVGGAGTLKSALAYAIVSERLKAGPEEHATYITLEETKEGHLANLASLGIAPNPKIAVSDIASFRADLRRMGDEGFREEDYLQLILKRAAGEGAGGGEGGPSQFLVLDSLNALEASLPADPRQLRRRLQDFFFDLRSRKVTTLALIETVQVDDRPEYFLVDGIVELGVARHGSDFKRFIHVRKMRSCKHEMRPFLLDVSEAGIRVMGEVID
ncbi:MAG TPA: ATPase domain-containing protein [Candidatus Thermoplasmatota archaeon]